VTKYRKKIFSSTHIKALKEIFGKVCSDFDTELIEVDGEKDHIHLLINYPPKVSISYLVNSLKGVSSRLLRKTFPELSKYYRKDVLWSPSYFAASCGGAPISVLRKYIEQQERPD
jgi:putative transposase